MNKIIECVCDGDLPQEFIDAGKCGKLQIYSAIGWIDLSPDDFDGGRNGCRYKIKDI